MIKNAITSVRGSLIGSAKCVDLIPFSCFLKYKTFSKSEATVQLTFSNISRKTLKCSISGNDSGQHWTNRVPEILPMFSSLVWKAAHGQTKVFIVGNSAHSRGVETRWALWFFLTQDILWHTLQNDHFLQRGVPFRNNWIFFLKPWVEFQFLILLLIAVLVAEI